MDDTNEKIYGFLNNFERKQNQQEDKNGYLVCDKCNGYYQLQEEESLKDFESCECGGTLKFKKKLDE